MPRIRSVTLGLALLFIGAVQAQAPQPSAGAAPAAHSAVRGSEAGAPEVGWLEDMDTRRLLQGASVASPGDADFRRLATDDAADVRLFGVMDALAMRGRAQMQELFGEAGMVQLRQVSQGLRSSFTTWNDGGTTTSWQGPGFNATPSSMGIEGARGFDTVVMLPSVLPHPEPAPLNLSTVVRDVAVAVPDITTYVLMMMWLVALIAATWWAQRRFGGR